MGESFIYHRSAKVRWYFVISLLLALVSDSLVISVQASPIFPPFSLLILFYWAGHFLDRTYIATAFILGLLIDTLTQTPLGAHSIIYVSLIYLLSRHRLHFRSFTPWQQAIFIVGYFFIYQLTHWVFFDPLLTSLHSIYFWLMPFSAAIFWIILAPLFNRLTQQVEQS